MSQSMKLPGPDHPITVDPYPRRVRVEFEGHLIADSEDVLILREKDYRPVFYFPRDDVSMEYFARSEHGSYCPYKGHANYYTLNMDGHIEENAVWTYEEPFPAMAGIADMVSFYPDKVDSIVTLPD